MWAAGPPSGSATSGCRTKPIEASYLGSGYRVFRGIKKCVETGYQATGHSRFSAASTNNCAISINCTTASTCLRLEQSYALTAADSRISLALLNASSVLRPVRTVKSFSDGGEAGCECSS